MRVTITSDANAESGVGRVVDETSGPTWHHFAPKTYGEGMRGLCVVLMCRDPELNFKRRIRFSTKEKELDMDIMLDLEQMKGTDHASRRRIIMERLNEEAPAVLSKYSIADFDRPRFVADWKAWLQTLAHA